MNTSKSSPNSIALLSHLRWISALTVVLSHVRQNFVSIPRYNGHITTAPGVFQRKDLFGLDGYGHAAVVVFFVLSGFLVGGKLIELANSNDVRTDWRRYLVDRAVRIFVVLWPACLFSALVCLALTSFLPNAPFVAQGGWAYDLPAPLGYDLSPVRLGAVATLLNELLVPTITSNGPLWSLSYEWSYYMIALAAVLIYRSYFTMGSVLVIAYAGCLLLLAAINQPNLLSAGISWVLGVAARECYNRDLLRGRLLRLLGLALVLAVLVVDHRHPLPDPALGGALAVMVAHSDWKGWRFATRFGERLSAFSYSLYVVHFPGLLAVMGAFYAFGLLPHPMKFGIHALIVIAGVTVIIGAFARGFAWATEDRTVAVRRFVLGLGTRVRGAGLGPALPPQ